MTLCHETPHSAGRLTAFYINADLRYFIAPDDGRPLVDYELRELRPFPAFDAMARLGGMCGGWTVQSMRITALNREGNLNSKSQ